MNETWLLPDQVFDGQTLLENTAIRLVDGKVVEIAPVCEASANGQRIEGIVTPGFIDLQVNGGGGVLFNQTPTVEGITTIVEAHHKFGTVGILPTVITDRPDVMNNAIDAAFAAHGNKGVLGIHIEGPHISVPRRGTHAAELVRDMDDATIAQVARLREAGIPVLITVAPETTSYQQISKLSELGAVVSIGHSDVAAETAHAAFDAGISCATHLFNGMSPMVHRAPGVTGAAINSNVKAGIIVDGVHVADEMVGLAFRARPEKDLMFLVSDAMPTVGGPDRFSLYGMDLRLENGRLVNDEGSLAGAHVTQAEGVHRLIIVIGLDPAEALRAAISVPAGVIGRDDLGRIVGRAAEDLICLNSDFSFRSYLDA